MRSFSWAGVTRRLSDPKWATVYLLVALVWGVLLVFLTPPFQNFDEPAHFYRAWSLAEGDVLPSRDIYVSLPANVAKLVYSFPVVPIIRGEVRVRPGGIWSQLGTRFSKERAPSVGYSAGYGPVGYLPQASAILVTRIIGRSPLASLYFGRLLNLVCSTLLVFLAIRLLPFAKAALFVIALLPMTVMQMASFSPDALLLAGCFLFLALVLKLATEERVTWPATVVLCLTGIFLLNAKPGYALIAFLVFLLRPSQFGGKKRYWTVVSILLLGALGLSALFVLTQPQSKNLVQLILGPDNGVDPVAQARYALAHPLAFPRAVLGAFQTNGLFYGKLVVGAFAWGSFLTSDVIAILAGLALAAIIAARENVHLAAWRRATILGVSAATAAVVCAVFYATFTRVGATTIGGLQGRYFTPSLLLAFVGLTGFPFGRRWLVPVVVGVIVVILAASTIHTIVRFYY